MKRIAIIGGGMAGLAAAFELTRTAALRERLEVTIYQMGWRLGGKAASSRDRYGRIVEHGLHVWFGCYENAFGLLNDAYHEWVRPPGQAIRDAADAFRGQNVTMIGSGDGPEVARMVWPEIEGAPGDGAADLSIWGTIAQLQHVLHHLTITFPPRSRVHRDGFARRYDAARAYAKTLADSPSARTEAELRSFVASIRSVAADHVAATKGDGADQRFAAQLADVGTAVVKGVIFDIVLGGLTVRDLDRIDFREWLSLNGADRSSVYESPLVRALYDSMFQYDEGDPRRPSYGAGTAAQVALRIYGTFRGAFVHELTAGMGETVVVPIYRVLSQRGVRFEFFHKLTRLELSDDRTEIARVHFDRQAALRHDRYEPTIAPGPRNGFLESWPDEPLWDQIEDADRLRGKDLESHWVTSKAGEHILRRGHEFHEVILAIPVTAFKPMNNDRGPCAELIEASARFRRMTEAAAPVPSVSVQAWLTRPARDLGGADPERAQLSTGPRPLNIWADRSELLHLENWPRTGGPRSVQYLCDVFETSLHREPIAAGYAVQQRADDLARRRAIHWFETKARAIWPGAFAGGPFDWGFLYDREGRTGAGRLGFQVVKANVDPSSCCAGSPAGSTQWRLAANESGFASLFLAGAWIDSGFNTECIETAVMSGRQAARAVARLDLAIPGEDFLAPPAGWPRIVGDLLDGFQTVLAKGLNNTRSRDAAETARRRAQADSRTP